MQYPPGPLRMQEKMASPYINHYLGPDLPSMLQRRFHDRFIEFHLSHTKKSRRILTLDGDQHKVGFNFQALYLYSRRLQEHRCSVVLGQYRVVDNRLASEILSNRLPAVEHKTHRPNAADQDTLALHVLHFFELDIRHFHRVDFPSS
jgi:hypothetical protein